MSPEVPVPVPVPVLGAAPVPVPVPVPAGGVVVSVEGAAGCSVVAGGGVFVRAATDQQKSEYGGQQIGKTHG